MAQAVLIDFPGAPGALDLRAGRSFAPKPLAVEYFDASRTARLVPPEEYAAHVVDACEIAPAPEEVVVIGQCAGAAVASAVAGELRTRGRATSAVEIDATEWSAQELGLVGEKVLCTVLREHAVDLDRLLERTGQPLPFDSVGIYQWLTRAFDAVKSALSVAAVSSQAFRGLSPSLIGDLQARYCAWLSFTAASAYGATSSTSGRVVKVESETIGPTVAEWLRGNLRDVLPRR